MHKNLKFWILCSPWSSFFGSINFWIPQLQVFFSAWNPSLLQIAVMGESSSSVWLWSFESKSKIAQRTDFSPTHTLSYTDLKSLHFSFHQLIYPFARHTFKLHLRFVSWRIRKEADTHQLRRSTLTSRLPASRNISRLLCQSSRTGNVQIMHLTQCQSLLFLCRLSACFVVPLV